MVDEAGKPFLIAYIIIFGIISIITAVQLGYSFKVTQKNKYKIRTHICISIICILSIIENGTMVAHNNDRKSHKFDLCDIPQRIVWIFLITAYLDVVYIWICAYQSVGDVAEGVRRRAKIIFITTDVVMGIVLLICAILNCVKEHETPGKVARIIYAASLSLVNISFSGLFLAYGTRIAYRLRQGLKSRTHTNLGDKDKDDTHNKAQKKVVKYIYRMTVRTIVMSIIWIVGALMFLIFGIIGSQNDTGKVQLIRTIHWSVLMGQMLYLAKPKKRKEHGGKITYT